MTSFITFLSFFPFFSDFRNKLHFLTTCTSINIYIISLACFNLRYHGYDWMKSTLNPWQIFNDDISLQQSSPSKQMGPSYQLRMLYKLYLKVQWHTNGYRHTTHSNYHNLALHLPQPSHIFQSAKPQAWPQRGERIQFSLICHHSTPSWGVKNLSSLVAVGTCVNADMYINSNFLSDHIRNVWQVAYILFTDVFPCVSTAIVEACINVTNNYPSSYSTIVQIHKFY